MRSQLSRLEQETSIHFNESDDMADVFAYNPALKRKLAELAKKYPEQIQYVRDDGGYGGELYKVDKDLISIRQPREKKELTDEERQAIRDRFTRTCPNPRLSIK